MAVTRGIMKHTFLLNFVEIVLLFPTPPVSLEVDRKSSKPVFKLPVDVELDTPSRDLLLRLLEVDPTKRMRSLRTLTTVAFFKGYNMQQVREKKVKPKTILAEHYPNGPPPKNTHESFEYFDGSY